MTKPRLAALTARAVIACIAADTGGVAAALLVSSCSTAPSSDGAASSATASALSFAEQACSIYRAGLTEPDLLSHVRGALSSSGLQPQRLVLEVTESAVVEDDVAAAAALDALSTIGVRISIDDFATGYSPLLYLHRYPISALRVGRAFVSGLGISADDGAFCSSAIDLAHAVGATSIGEGVETADQYAALRSYGCQQGQGYLWSPAVPIDDLKSVLAGCLEVPIPSADRPRLSLRHQLGEAVSTKIEATHRDGGCLQTIATHLNQAALTPPLGSRWTAGDVARHLAATSAA